MITRLRRPLILAAAALVLAACSDRQPDVTAPAAPPAFAAAGQASSAAPSGLDLIEQDYAGGALDRNTANRFRMYALHAPGKLPARYRTAGIGKDATWSMVQLAKEFDQLSAQARAEILDLEAKGFGDLKESVQTPHFVLHYTTTGGSAVPAQDANANGVPDFIDEAAASWEYVWNREVGQLGYPTPKGTPLQKFHVYYRNLDKYYGYAAPTNVELLATTPVAYGTASAYIVIENDFYGFPRNDEDRTGTEIIRSGALKVTQAHEFMHAIQFNINVYGSGWLMESHATWAEDAVYDGINDWHWYINSFLRRPDLPLFSRYLYGAAFFQHWLSETRGTDVQRQIWLALRTQSAADAIRTVGLGGAWEAIKEYAPAQYLLDLSDFTRDPASVIPVPVNFINARHDAYPVSVTVAPSTNRVPNRAPWGLGTNYIEFAGTASGTLTIDFDGADGYAWRAYAIARRANGPASVVTIPLNDAAAGSVSIAGFGSRWVEVTLAATIADQAGAEVPYSYAARVQ